MWPCFSCALRLTGVLLGVEAEIDLGVIMAKWHALAHSNLAAHFDMPDGKALAGSENRHNRKSSEGLQEKASFTIYISRLEEALCSQS